MRKGSGRVLFALLSSVLLISTLSSSLECNAISRAAEVELTIFYSGDLSGYLEPCG